MAGNYLGAGIGIVFVILGVDTRETRIFRERHEPRASSSIVPKGIELLSTISTQPAQASNNEALPIDKLGIGYRSCTRVT